MQKPQSFIFEAYELDREVGKISLRYGFDDDYHFTETIELGRPVPEKVPETEVEAALFALHMIGGVSYFKAFCPEKLIVKSGELDEAQAKFWQTVYEKGLGEFSYQNQLDLRGKIKFPVSESVASPRQLEARPGAPKKVLSLFGGGKDSMATAEILRAVGVDYTFMRVGQHPIIEGLFAQLQRPTLTVRRQLDAKLFELNEQGAYNGHVPITTYIATLNVLLSLLYGYDAVVISSERSSSYGNVEYLGEEINHQWSKSAEFEAMFRDYLSQYVTRRVDYVNLLGSLSELQIARIVSDHPEYLHRITSCNRNWAILAKRDHEESGLWCGRCPKCTFTFALLAAWLPIEEVVDIFGQNLFDAPENEELYRELFGLSGFKPFECVGTPDEMITALHLANQRQSLARTMVGRMYQDEVLPKVGDVEAIVKEALAPHESLAGAPEYVQKWLQKGGVTA